MKVWRDLLLVARMVKIEHSIFALPFAYIGLFMAAGGWPGWDKFLLLTLAMVAVRSFAMAYNRLADRDIDAKNLRTRDRPLVTGELTVGFTRAFLVSTAIVFTAACAGLNMTCLALAPVALLWSAFYSLTKRFTWACHYVLGSVLGLAPVAGWISVDPALTWPAVCFFLGVTCWVAGFDLLYACQDVEFDRNEGLNSLPARFGVGAALLASSLTHVGAGAAFLLAGALGGLGWVYFSVAGACCLVLVLEHRLISERDMSRVNLAFFTMNGFIAVALCAGVLLDIFL